MKFLTAHIPQIPRIPNLHGIPVTMFNWFNFTTTLIARQIPIIPNVHVRTLHKYVFGMNKAYLRHSHDGGKFEISFRLTDATRNVDRSFNFSRSTDENVAAFLARVTVNVEKVLNKQANKKKKKQKDALPSEPLPIPISVALFINEAQIPDDVCCKQVFLETNKVTLKLLDKQYEVIVNAPYVDSLALPTSMLATFPVYPLKFEAVFADEQRTQFMWFKSLDKTKWDLIGKGYILQPALETIGYYLKLVCIPKNQYQEGPQTEVVSDTLVAPSPGQCPFDRRHEYTEQRSAENEFRVVTYNILADLYCDSDYTRTVLHPYCPPYALSIDYRKQLIIKELLGYNSDIICLQEVDRKVFNYDLEPVFRRKRFDSDLVLKGGQCAEGLAMFYHKDKFRLVAKAKMILSEELELSEIFNDFRLAIYSNDKLKARFAERQTAAQVVVLECLHTKNIIIVANTHLYFHPDADHIRLLQGAMCIRYIESMLHKIPTGPNKKPTIVFCGDFNSVPACGIYKLFTEGAVPHNFIDWSSNADEVVKDFSLTQPFNLGSACGTPAYTNYTVGFADCLDYIFYDTKTVEVVRSVPMPTNDELIAHTALPSIVFPSDHISLCADFRWK